MNRRNFIKGSAAMGLAGMTTPNLMAKEQPTNAIVETFSVPPVDSKCQFRFNANGKFKIMQITDTHHDCKEERSMRALRNVREMVEKEMPDLVIHTGDVSSDHHVRESVTDIMQPVIDHKIPFVITMGNHDGEFEITRKAFMEHVRTLPYNINPPAYEGVHGYSNAVITLASHAGDKIHNVFYVFDSHNYMRIKGMKGEDFIHFDQIQWYRTYSNYFKKLNGGKPVPSFALFHIPIYEFKSAVWDGEKAEIHGIKSEEVCCSESSCGLFLAAKEQGDIQAFCCGHDHFNDYIMDWNYMCFMYGRFSGGDMSNGNLHPSGARIIELTEGEPGFRTWLRLYGGEIHQNIHYPMEFRHYYADISKERFFDQYCAGEGPEHKPKWPIE